MKKQSIVNHLRSKYANMEEAYLLENNKVIPKCPYCNNNRKFQSFFKGYNKTCNSDKCKYKETLFQNRKTAKNKFNKFNKDINSNCKVCNKVIKIKFRDRNLKHLCNSKFCYKNRMYGCFEEKIIDNFKTDFIYLNKLIYNLREKFSRKKTRKILYRNLLIKKIKSPKEFLDNKALRHVLKKDLKCLILIGDSYYFDKNSTYIENEIKNIFNKNYNKLVEEFFSSSITNCIICNKRYIFKQLIKGKELRSPNTCSIKCYRKNYKQFITKERINKQSKGVKKAIAENRFTPNVTNSWTHFSALYKKEEKEFKFRSIYELVFHISNLELSYETVRIPYFINEKQKSYIVDFEDKENRTLFEIKPKSLKEKELNKIKQKAAVKWCKENNYTYQIIDQYEIFKTTFEDFNRILKRNNISISIELENKIFNYYKKYGNSKNQIS